MALVPDKLSDQKFSFAAAGNNRVRSAFIGLDMCYQIGTRFSVSGNTEYSHSIDGSLSLQYDFLVNGDYLDRIAWRELRGELCVSPDRLTFAWCGFNRGVTYLLRMDAYTLFGALLSV